METDSDDDNPIGHLIREKKRERGDPDETQPLAVRIRKKKKKDLRKIVDALREDSPAEENLEATRLNSGQYAKKRIRVTVLSYILLFSYRT